MKYLIASIAMFCAAFGSSQGHASDSRGKNLSIHITVSENGNLITETTQSVPSHERIAVCIGSPVIYPVELQIAKRHECNGLSVKIDPMNPASEALEINYKLDYFRKTSNISEVDSRLPIFNGFSLATSETFKKGEVITHQSGPFEIKISAEF